MPRPTNKTRVYHGLSKTPTYRTWISMHTRCTDPANASFRHYGAKGVRVCERWNNFALFIADMGMRPEGKTIDRINNALGYEASNCRWATLLEQQRNRNGVKCDPNMAIYIRSQYKDGKAQRQLARDLGFNQSTIHSIIHLKTWK